MTFCYSVPSRFCTLLQGFLILHVGDRYSEVAWQATQLTSRVGPLTFDSKSCSPSSTRVTWLRVGSSSPSPLRCVNHGLSTRGLVVTGTQVGDFSLSSLSSIVIFSAYVLEALLLLSHLHSLGTLHIGDSAPPAPYFFGGPNHPFLAHLHSFLSPTDPQKHSLPGTPEPPH